MAPPDGLDAETFAAFRDLIHASSGIALQPGKEALLLARIGKRMRQLGLGDPASYLALVRDDQTQTELVDLLDAIATNVTSFFREADHFEVLAEAHRAALAAGRRRFRYWSAACSSGEEPYTMAMVLLAANGDATVDLKILATDLSTRILARATAGRYPLTALEPVPPAWRRRFFEPGADGLAQAGADLRGAVVFRHLNLSTPPFPMQGPLDAIFLRNVMIYFDEQGRQRVVDEAVRLLKPGGYLFCGHAESLNRLRTPLRLVQPSVYLKPVPGAPERGRPWR
jgi:chemotaxis protein methyltransferase CheR